jgi:DNA-binding response OmpR family regulator
MHKVLLVEDDPTMLSLLETLLEIEGFQVVPIHQVASALELLESEQPDLVLMDVHLKDGDGFELLRRIREKPGFEKTLVLMSSGMDFAAACKEAGADGFILKPYMPDELISRVRLMLAKH